MRPQYIARPPERSKVNPVVKLTQGEIIQAIISSTSVSVPQRPIGVRNSMYST